ncbi:MAG TPA: DUF4412 domain-containing protein [Deltaproteobacteria bacterium]|nr:DUF4412 domain-containing protein [Deltaproteobacteria bacterium]
MKTKHLLYGSFLFVLSAVALPGILHADMHLKYKHHMDAFEIMGQTQPATDTVRETWIAKDMIRNDEGNQTIILRLDKKQLYFIDHANKTYSQGPMELDKMATQAIDEDEDMDAEEKEQAKQFMQGMMGAMKMSISVKETGEKKKIGSWKCTKYLQTTEVFGTTSTADVWATNDIQTDYELLNRMNASSMMMISGMRESMDEFIREMNKIKGVIVYTVSTSSAMNTQMKSTQELVEYSDKKAPAGFFDPPKGYKKQAM